ncbi:unnamed protein product [Lasius platythorax]|uniref:Uncharacterized protein n=1 Tax=Lasius platythorax TaxID=488582 RepID=A0AAV2P9Y5_9HYME
MISEICDVHISENRCRPNIRLECNNIDRCKGSLSIAGALYPPHLRNTKAKDTLLLTVKITLPIFTVSVLSVTPPLPSLFVSFFNLLLNYLVISVDCVFCIVISRLRIYFFFFTRRR